MSYANSPCRGRCIERQGVTERDRGRGIGRLRHNLCHSLTSDRLFGGRLRTVKRTGRSRLGSNDGSRIASDIVRGHMGETITLDINLRAFVRRETKARWVAVCPRIDVASQGKTAAEAKSFLRQAVELWFESCVERGVLDKAMREANFRPLPSGEAIPAESEHVLVNRAVAPDEDVLGDLFPIRIEIPAYQAASILASHA
jgi:predicted RNase H-like HicB family nuclease